LAWAVTVSYVLFLASFSLWGGYLSASRQFRLPSLHGLSTASPVPAGWGKAVSNGGQYDVGIDHAVTHAGKAAAYVKPVVAEPSPRFVGNLMQSFRADDYRGKRLCLSAFVKTHEVQNCSMLWMRVDGATKKTLSFDDMRNRPLKGTADWKKYEIVL